MRIIILDAYARSNAGDGLLVDETCSIVRQAFPSAELQLVAMAPETFQSSQKPSILYPGIDR